MHVLIAGNGIAGPALGAALSRAGATVDVFESRAHEESDAGAFLVLAPNGIKALAAMGLDGVADDAAGVPLNGVEFLNAGGRRVGRLDGSGEDARFGARNHLVLRAGLHRALRSRADEAGARTTYSSRIVGVKESRDGVTVDFSDGRTASGDVLVGADGVRSTVRRHVWPEVPDPQWTGIVDCGGLASVDVPDTGVQRMVFGHRAFFGYVVAEGTAYWFSNVAPKTEPSKSHLAEVDRQAWLQEVRALHCDDPDPVGQILAAATTTLGVRPVHDLPDLRTWHTDRVCLIGDSAHATSPNAGQGASLAFEDAAVLTLCLQASPDPRTAFAVFESLRKERAERIVKLGRRLGSSKIPSPAGAWFRDRLLPVFLKAGVRDTVEQYDYRVADVDVEAAVAALSGSWTA